MSSQILLPISTTLWCSSRWIFSGSSCSCWLIISETWDFSSRVSGSRTMNSSSMPSVNFGSLIA